MAQCKTIGKELIAGSVVICKKCKSHFDATINVKTHKPYTWCKDCRETLTKTTKRNKKSTNKQKLVNKKGAAVASSEPLGFTRIHQEQPGATQKKLLTTHAKTYPLTVRDVRGGTTTKY